MKNSKSQIYKGIVQYIVETTNYTLKDIADLSSCSLSSIQAFYRQESKALTFSSEMQLVKLYQIILRINSNEEECSQYLPPPTDLRQLRFSGE